MDLHISPQLWHYDVTVVRSFHLRKASFSSDLLFVRMVKVQSLFLWDVLPCSEHAFLALKRLHHFSSKAGLLELINLLSSLIIFSLWPCSMMQYTFCALQSLHSDISLVWAGNITRALINISASCWDLHVYILENQCTLTEGGTHHQQAQDVKWVQVLALFYSSWRHAGLCAVPTVLS